MSSVKEKAENSYVKPVENDNSEAGSVDQKKVQIVEINSMKADGGAYKGCPKNDYCQHLVDTGERPQNFIRDYEEEKRFLGKFERLNQIILN
jgi:hypothetical protein